MISKYVQTGVPSQSLINRLIAKVVPPALGFSAGVKKVYKQMVTSSQEDIDLHNKAVKTRQVVRAKKRSDDKLMRK